jgi:pyruvate/2-oxoglutarate/acetoin dehydrogenase E1 component
MAERAFRHLKGSIQRAATADVPIPFSPTLETFVEPTRDKIEAAIRSVLP